MTVATLTLATELNATNMVDVEDMKHEDHGEITYAGGTAVIEDSIAVSSWTLTTSSIATSLTVTDDDWIGLGAAAGRIQFDDQTTDEINILSAVVGLGTETPDTTLQVVGTAGFGDDAGNETLFAADGLRTMVGTARVVKYEWIPASALAAHGAKAATYTTFPNAITSAWEFADNADNAITFSIKVPDDMDFTAASYICIGWSSPVVSGDCYWYTEYLMTEEGDDTDGAATDTNGGLLTTADAADEMVRSSFITIAANALDANSLCLHIAVTRDISEDALGGVAHIHGAVFMYTADRDGEDSV